MIFTLYYMYATILQWWRLGALKNKLNGTLGAQNALLVCSGSTISEPKNPRCLENLLYQRENKIACTVVPRQKINLNTWIHFPKDERFFPIHIKESKLVLSTPKVYLLLSAQLDKYFAHHGEIIQIEDFGEPVAWRSSENFDVILKTDTDSMTKLVYYFSNHNIDINHELRLLKLETVDVEGVPTKIKYDKKFTLEQRLKYSHSPVHWKKFAKDVNSIYLKLNDANPKIMIENGMKTEDTSRKVPVSEVKPMKKDKKSLEKAEKKNTLDVQSRSKTKSDRTREDRDKSRDKDHKIPKEGEKEDGKSKHREHKHKDRKHKDTLTNANVEIAKDEMTKDEITKDEMTKDGMTKDEMSKESLEAVRETEISLGNNHRNGEAHQNLNGTVKITDKLQNVNTEFETSENMELKNGHQKRSVEIQKLSRASEDIGSKDDTTMHSLEHKSKQRNKEAKMSTSVANESLEEDVFENVEATKVDLPNIETSVDQVKQASIESIEEKVTSPKGKLVRQEEVFNGGEGLPTIVTERPVESPVNNVPSTSSATTAKPEEKSSKNEQPIKEKPDKSKGGGDKGAKTRDKSKDKESGKSKDEPRKSIFGVISKDKSKKGEKEAKTTKKDDKDGKIDEKQSKKDDKHAKKDDKLSKKDEKPGKIDEKEAKKDDTLVKKDEKLVKKDEKLVKKDEKLAKKDEKLAKKDEKLAKKDEKLAKKDEKLAKRDEKLAKIDDKQVKKDEKQGKKDEKQGKSDEKAAAVKTQETAPEEKDGTKNKKDKSGQKSRESSTEKNRRSFFGSSDSATKSGQSSAASSRQNTSDNLKSTTKIGDLKAVKPPNVLVYADSLVAKENVKGVLNTILNKEKYTVYDLPLNLSSQMWNSSTVLVIVCGSVTPNLTGHLLQYLVNGGQLLCLCSDLLHSVLQTFTTAEVREHELVRFSYGEWKRVKMMHHIFCYQASPAKKQFSKDSDQSSSNHSNGSSPVAPRTPSTVDIQHNGKNYTIQVQVLGTEETWQTPSLLLASVKNSTGRAIFSQVHLEIDPTQYEDDESKFAALKDSNEARLEILKDILSNRLDMDCTNLSTESTYAPGYFLGRHELKMDLLNTCDSIKDNTLTSDKMSLVFCAKGVEPGLATKTRLPIWIHLCPTNFSTVQYFETLETKEIGRLVVYSDVLTSSQDVLTKKLCHGFVVIPRQQTQGTGRSNNNWLSPPGCAMFTLQLHVPLDSIFGKSIPLLQHFIMVAIVSAVRNKEGYENIDLRIKWPNDLYVFSKVKIGGLVVNTTVESNTAIVNIGCGINLDNRNPTTCLNEVIKKYNEDNSTNLRQFSYEKFLAMVFNEVERIYDIVQGGNLDYFHDLYNQYWLHSNSDITVNTTDGQSRKVKILGIDEYGYLKVRAADGTISSVQPDGNTFDMLKGLIAPKIT